MKDDNNNGYTILTAELYNKLNLSGISNHLKVIKLYLMRYDSIIAKSQDESMGLVISIILKELGYIVQDPDYIVQDLSAFDAEHIAKVYEELKLRDNIQHLEDMVLLNAI